jgi:hypothetical protein
VPVPPGVVVVSVPVPPLVPSWVQADKAMGRMAKLRAKALAETILDKSEIFILVVPLKLVNSGRFLILRFKKSRPILTYP